MNSPDSYPITYLLGAGMVHDLCEWIGIALIMVGCSVTVGVFLGWLRKRRIAKIQRAAVAMNNYEHWVTFYVDQPTVPADLVDKSRGTSLGQYQPIEPVFMPRFGEQVRRNPKK